jgi:hypothetical protein
VREDHINRVLAHLRDLDGGAPLSAWARDRGRLALLREIAGGSAPRLPAAHPRGVARWRGSRRLGVGAGGCVPKAAARRLVHRALARHGFGRTWRIATGRFSPAAPCASLAIDSDARVVTLVPIPHA